MAANGKIVWLASYPKSGNTWFRVFLANLFSGSGKPVNINQISHSNIASNRQLFDETAGISASDLSKPEIERLRPYVYDELSNSRSDLMFLKIHDAFTFTTEGRPLVSEHACFKALYFIRNPLDVAVSLAHHLAVPFENAVNNMCNPKFAFCQKPDRLYNQLEQRLLRWDEHVLSWQQQKYVPVKIVRYEDMLSDTFNTFWDAINFLNIECDIKTFEKSLQFSNFNELKKQEQAEGFREKAPGAKSFFRKGKANDWVKKLPPPLAEKIKFEFAAVMKQYQYL